MINMEKVSKIRKMREWLREYHRVLKITKKPDTQEFKMIVKVTGIGIALIGLIGFVITMLKQVLF